MFVSALAALVMFAAPESGQSGAASTAPPAAAKTKPKKTCYSEASSESRLPRRVCVIETPKTEPKAETAEAQASPDAPKSE